MEANLEKIFTQSPVKKRNIQTFKAKMECWSQIEKSSFGRYGLGLIGREEDIVPDDLTCLQGGASKIHLVIRQGFCFSVLVIIIQQSLDHILVRTVIHNFVLYAEIFLFYRVFQKKLTLEKLHV